MWGDARSTPLLFWPGLTLGARLQLVEAGPRWSAEYAFRVLSVEPPGWSSPPLAAEHYRPSALASLVVDIVDALALERIAYVGYSWGASIGCHLAAAAPDVLSALVLLDAGYTDFQDREGFEEKDLETLTAEMVAESATLRFATWDEYLETPRRGARSWRPALEERARSGMREVDGAIVLLPSPEAFAAAMYGVVAEPPSATLVQLGRLDLPILLVAASDTARGWGAAPLERFRAAVPAADVEIVESRHDLLADAPAETIALVGDWLRSKL